MCFCILKYLFVFFNVILIKLGVGIVAAGILIIIGLKEAKIEAFQNVGIFIIVFGCIFTAIFFCGCCGAVTKNNCLLITYSVIIFCFAILTTVSTVLYSNSMTDIKDLVVGETTGNLNVVQIWEPLLKCCGTTGPDSYEGAIPITCCPDFGINNLDVSQIGGSLDDLNIFTCNKVKAYKRGCQEVLEEYVQDILNIILNILIYIDIAQVVMLLVAILLIYENRRHRRKGIAY